MFSPYPKVHCCNPTGQKGHQKLSSFFIYSYCKDGFCIMTPPPSVENDVQKQKSSLFAINPSLAPFMMLERLLGASCRAPHEHDFLKKVEALSLPKTRLFIIVEMPLAVLSEAFPGLISLQTSSCKPSPSACTQRTLQREVSHVLREYTWKPKRHFRLWMLIFLLCISLLASDLSSRQNSHTPTLRVRETLFL